VTAPAPGIITPTFDEAYHQCMSGFAGLGGDAFGGKSCTQTALAQSGASAPEVMLRTMLSGLPQFALMTGGATAIEVAPGLVATAGSAAEPEVQQALQNSASQGQGAASATRGLWSLNPFARGTQIEQMLGQNLPQNYPTWDRYANGVATSIKSIDLGAKTYQSAGNLTTTLNRYVSAAQNGILRTWSWAPLTGQPITQRVVQVAVPWMPTAGSAQATVLAAVQQSALNAGVSVQYVVVP